MCHATNSPSQHILLCRRCLLAQPLIATVPSAPQALSVDEARERAARLAKMRHLLFYAELKAKRLSKIKSKEYHRKMNKAAKRKAQQLGVAGEDNESARKAALEEAEFERAKVHRHHIVLHTKHMRKSKTLKVHFALLSAMLLS